MAKVKEPMAPAEPKKPARGLAPADETGAQAALKGLLREFLALLETKDNLKRDTTENNQALEELQLKLVEGFDRYGCQNLNMKDMGLFYRSSESHPKVIDEDKLFADLKRRKMGDLIKSTVHYQTLRAALSELEKKGQPELAGVEVFTKQVVRHRSAKTKE